MSDIIKNIDTEAFIQNGYVRIDHAFSETVAGAARDILWNDIPFDRADPESWTEPVVRLGMYTEQPFIDAVNSPALYGVFDRLVGEGKWMPCRSVGTFPVRFPSNKAPDDTGKHVDASFPGKDPSNFPEWRINVRSRGRGLLMLLLFSDVTAADAPTLLWKGSHLDVARILDKEGEEGLSFMELAGKLDTLPEREKALATGRAGTIYLCHPFLVHAAQAHRGTTPRFMAQPPLLLRDALTISGPDAGYSPVEAAIRQALAGER